MNKKLLNYWIETRLQMMKIIKEDNHHVSSICGGVFATNAAKKDGSLKEKLENDNTEDFPDGVYPLWHAKCGKKQKKAWLISKSNELTDNSGSCPKKLKSTDSGLYSIYGFHSQKCESTGAYGECIAYLNNSTAKQRDLFLEKIEEVKDIELNDSERSKTQAAERSKTQAAERSKTQAAERSKTQAAKCSKTQASTRIPLCDIKEFYAERRTILSPLIQDTFNLMEKNSDIAEIVSDSIPILWFGNIIQYFKSGLKVVTIGQNPSKHEFSKPRFLKIKESGKGKTEEEQISYIDDLCNYFLENPYNKWFGGFRPYYLHQFGASYNETAPNRAIHIDIGTPVATDPTWGAINDSTLRNKLGDPSIFERLIKFLNPDILLSTVKFNELSKSAFGEGGSVWFDDFKLLYDNEKDGNRRLLGFCGKEKLLICTSANGSSPFYCIPEDIRQKGMGAIKGLDIPVLKHVLPIPIDSKAE